MSRRREHVPSGGAPAQASDRIGWGWLAAIVVAALAYRALCFSVVGAHPLLRHPVVDAGYHDAWARRIADGDWLGHGPDDVFKPPLYPYFLAGLNAPFGRHIALVQWVQHVLGAVSCVLVALLGARLLGPAAGRLAGFISAGYAPYVFFESQLLTPPLSILLNLVAIHLLASPERGVGRGRLAAAGALFGLSAAVRPDVLLPAALVVLYLMFHHRRLGRRRLAIGAVCLASAAAGVILPVLVRNYHITKQFVPVASSAGVNFYVGNATGADGVTAVPVGLRWERLVARVPQEVLEKPATASRWWMRAAWREIRAAPGAAVLRLARKALAFWNRREFRNNICYHFMQRIAWPLRFCPGQFAAILPLAACGLLSLWRSAAERERTAFALCGLWVGGYWIVGIAFFVTARFRLPAVPLLILPAAWGIVRIAAALRQRRWTTLSGHLAAVVAAGVLSSPMWLGRPENAWVRDRVSLGNSLRDASNPHGARQAYRDALELEPNDPDARYLLAHTLLRQRPAKALEHLQIARSVIPDSPDVLLAIATAHMALGNATQARQTLCDLLSLAATSNLWPKRAACATAHVHLADLEPAAAAAHWEKAWSIDRRTAAEAAFLKRTDLPRALEAFQAEARANPWDWYAHANCGTALLDAGRAEEAVAAYRKAVRLAPERAALRFHLAHALLQTASHAEAAPLLGRLSNELPPCPLRRQVEDLRRRTTSQPR